MFWQLLHSVSRPSNNVTFDLFCLFLHSLLVIISRRLIGSPDPTALLCLIEVRGGKPKWTHNLHALAKHLLPATQFTTLALAPLSLIKCACSNCPLLHFQPNPFCQPQFLCKLALFVDISRKLFQDLFRHFPKYACSCDLLKTSAASESVTNICDQPLQPDHNDILIFICVSISRGFPGQKVGWL